jgi:hypothetical protein
LLPILARCSAEGMAPSLIRLRAKLELHSILKGRRTADAWISLSYRLQKRNQMAKCSLCGAETQLYTTGVPICVACATARDQKIKQELTTHSTKSADAQSAVTESDDSIAIL